MSELKVSNEIFDLKKSLLPGDCIVCFSIDKVH